MFSFKVVAVLSLFICVYLFSIHFFTKLVYPEARSKFGLRVGSTPIPPTAQQKERKLEGVAITVSDQRIRQTIIPIIVRSEPVPKMSRPDRVSSGQDIHQQSLSSVQSVPTTALQEPSFGIPRRDRLVAGTSQVELVRPDVTQELTQNGLYVPNETLIPYERARRDQYLNSCVPLYQAALKGDWHAAEIVLGQYPDAVRAPLTKWNERALHIAVLAKRTTFVKNLMSRMTSNDLLELRSTNGETTLYYAALSGIVTSAEEMVKLDQRLPCIRDVHGRTPLYLAALLGHRHMTSYLFSVTPFEELTTAERTALFFATVSTDLYDTALKILKKDRTLVTAVNSDGKIALEELARKPLAIGGRNQLSVWERCLKYFGFKRIFNKALQQTLVRQLVEDIWKEIRMLPERQFTYLIDNHTSLVFDAARSGNVEFLIILIRSYPDVLRMKENGRTLFHIAVLYRQEAVFDLIYEIGGLKDLIACGLDENGNNMLHLVGESSPPGGQNFIPGAAFQLQKEFWWFKKVESIVLPPYVDKKNLDSETPREKFMRTHRELQNEGEKWMKGTAKSCMLVATLVAGIVFAAAFTVPGGNDDATGVPTFLGNVWFAAFFGSDAVSLIFSSTSVLFFLSILTSRYTEKDFLRLLPGKLLLGFLALFISIVSMLISFNTSSFLIWGRLTTLFPACLFLLGGQPIFSFLVLHYNLWVDSIRMIPPFSLFVRPRKHRLF